MDSTFPLYRQLKSRFLLLSLSFFLLCFVGGTYYFQHQQGLAVVKYQQLPMIEEYSQRQLLLNKHQRLLNEVIYSKYVTKFSDDYQALTKNLTKISALSRNNRRLLERLTQRMQRQAEDILSLAESERRNNQLKDNAIIQLTLVADSLSNLITTQSRQQQELYRQITQDNLTDRVTAIRAKALSDLVSNLNTNRQLQQAIVDALVMFNQLDLQYDLINFDYIQQKMSHEINQWLANEANVVDKNQQENSLFEQSSVLYDLLFSEQNTFKKWRTQIRRANIFQAELVQQKAELMPLFEKKLTVPTLKPSFFELQLEQWSSQMNIDIQGKDIIWFVAAFFCLSGFGFIIVLLSIRGKIKHYGLQSVASVREFVSKGEVEIPPVSSEVSEIIAHIKELSRPEHSEADFQEQRLQFQKYAGAMSRHSGCVFFQLPIESKKKQQQLCKLLAVDFSDQHWRHCFSRTDVRTILSIARQAKEHQKVEKASLTSRQGKAISLTIEYIDNTWCGSLSSAEALRLIKGENSQLQRKLQQQNQEDKLATIANFQLIIDFVSAAMQEMQMLSLISDDELRAYQKLQQLFCWSEQQKISAQLRRDDFILTLSAVNLNNELSTVLLNVGLQQVTNNNAVYLNVASNVVSFVTLESELFQALIYTTCRIMLAEQYGVELVIDVQLVDVNAEQQILKVSFEINNASDSKSLSQIIEQMASDEEISPENQIISQSYLRDLQLVFNVSDKTAQQLESVGKFCFHLPLAIAQELNQNNHDISLKLNKCSVLVIATEKSSRNRICQQFINSKAVVETIQDLSLFRRQISIDHLTKNRVDIIILAPEIYASDYDLVTKHLATLPEKLQPKILVIQPFYCNALEKRGLFNHCNFPWFAQELRTSVTQLKNNNNQTNLLLAAEKFEDYKFLPTQVEILLGVAEPNKYQALIRVLSWLGLQITLVSQQERLDCLWQSGRYFVVISEFLPTHFTLDNCATNARGVFSLLDDESDKTDINCLILPETWYRGEVRSTFDISLLIEQLSPWLKVDGNEVSAEINSSILPEQPISNTVSVRLSSASNLADEALDFDTLDSTPLFDASTLSSAFHLSDDSVDLIQYADNQGSAELAAFMLDEYVLDIHAYALTLEHTIELQNYHLALQSLKSLAILAKVIAAEPLLMQCQGLELILKQINNHANNIEFSNHTELSLQKEQLQAQLNQLKLCIEQLTEFAESI